MADEERKTPRNQVDTDGKGEQERRESLIPEEVNTMLEGIPQEKREAIERFIGISFGMMRMSPEGEISKKVTSEHIDQMLKTSDRAMENSFKAEHELRIHRLIYFGGAIIILFGVILLLKDNPAIMKDVLNIGLGAVLGAFGGFGYAKYKRKEDNE